MTSTFTCEHCGGTFPKAWSDEEALAEAEGLFGEALGDDPAVVCDDCFHELTPPKSLPELVALFKSLIREVGE